MKRESMNMRIVFYFIFVFAFMHLIKFQTIHAANKPESGAKFATSMAQKTPQDNRQNQNNIITKAQVKKFIEKQLTIYGRIAKPQAVFIIPGTDPKVDGLKIERQFFDLIFRPVVKNNIKRHKKDILKNKDYIEW